MFSSSLRSRTQWAPVVPTLARSHPGWKGATELPCTKIRLKLMTTLSHAELDLEGCHVAFPVTNTGGKTDSVFRILLLTSGELRRAEIAEGIERLRNLDGGHHVGIIVLLEGSHAMQDFAKLQVNLLFDGGHIPIVPVLNAADLPSCLDGWRRHLSGMPAFPNSPVTPKSLIPQCVHGPPLAERQTNIVMDLCSGFRKLVNDVDDPVGLKQMADHLGRKDAERVADFLRGGSRPMDM